MGVSSIWIAIGASVLGAVYAAIYHALTVTGRVEVESLAETRAGEKAARRIGHLMDRSGALARSAGLAALAAFALAALGLVEWVADLRDHTTPDLVDSVIGLAIGALVGWLLGIATAMAAANFAGARVIWSNRVIIRATGLVLSPLEPAALFIEEVVRRLAGVQRKQIEEQAQDELLTVIEEGEAKGAFDEEEREMIEAVVSFKDRTVQQIMTPRPDIEAMELTNDLGAITKTVKALRHSRIPVYGESLDQIIGIFYAKDLLHWLGGEGARTGHPFDLKSILRTAHFVPETKTVRELMREMMDKKVHIAMVADEYGGTSGLVTIEDIVEEIFGDIRDEYEVPGGETPDVVLRPDQGRADLDAAARIVDVNGALESMGIQIPEGEEYDTVGGFVLAKLGRIPRKGEKFDFDRMKFTILDAKPTRVVKVSLEVKPDKPEVKVDGAAKVKQEQ